MFIDRKSSGAGGYAHGRYLRGLHAWRARAGRRIALMLGPLALVGVAVLLIDRQSLSWCAGAITGMVIGLWIAVRDAPPSYVESWRDGAEGERRTAKQLKRLERSGWRVVHDIQARYGNYDHVVVGPAGVFLLETKNLIGIVEIRDGVPHLMRRLDPDADTACVQIKPRALSAAVRLKQDIQQRAGRNIWVQAVVVIWSDFPQGIVEDERCIFVHGTRLQTWLRERPCRLGQFAIEQIAQAIEQIAAEAAGTDTDAFSSHAKTA